MTSNSDDESDHEDEIYSDIGFMFEGSHASVLKHYAFPSEPDDGDGAVAATTEHAGKSVHVALHVVDDEPGAVQSGHYLWPAAPALCEYLVKNAATIRTPAKLDGAEEDLLASGNGKLRSVVELGAGTALVAIVALQMFWKDLDCVFVTDHDPGTLEKAKNNHETTMEELYDQATTEEDQSVVLNEISAVPFYFEELKWGVEAEIKRLQHKIHGRLETPQVDMIVGSDLIYCFENVDPLLLTVSKLLDRGQGVFLLSQSFAYDEETEQQIDLMSAKLGLERIVHADTLGSKGGSKIQRFRFS